MAELLANVQSLQQLQPSVHWFCDRRDSIQNHNTTNSDNRKRSELEISSLDRRSIILESLKLFAYDSPEIAPQKNALARGIDQHLEKCDVCIVEYYKLKRRLIEKLRDEYEDDEVEKFGNIFHERDINRIKKGLSSAASKLRSLPPEARGKDALQPFELLAIFESLSCEQFLEDRELIQQHLEEPFNMLQTNVRLQVTHFVPAATFFLFDSAQTRCFWAMHTWTKYRAQLQKEDFDFAVREPLSRILAIASNPITDMNFVQRLWCGIRLIIDKADSDLITHSLRAMEFDVCRLALEHLRYDTAGLRFLLQTVEKLLSKAPNDFWDAMGAISPTTFIEQIFNNPQYDRFVVDARENEKYEYSALKDMLAWIPPFMASLHTSHQPSACRSLTFQLLDRLQASRFPEYARIECFHVGLGVLTWTLGNCNKDRNTFDTVGRVAATEILTVTSTYIKEILVIPGLPPDNAKHIALLEPCVRVLKSALALECKSLRTDQELLQNNELLPHGYSSYSPAIWDAVVRNLDRGNVELAKASLSSISDLTGLEKFLTKGSTSHLKEKSEFNVIFGQLTHLVCQMLERINDFNPGDLDKLFEVPESANALVSSLFSADASTYEAGMNLIKSLSGESTRKEAIRHLLLPFFETTLNSFSWSVRRIAHKRTYASCPRMLKTCTDVLDILCDAQDGLLRNRSLSGMAEIMAVKNFWEHQWEALRVIYEMTEDWSRRINDSAVMKDFCRDTMQFSDHFFDQYSIFASAVDAATHIKQEDGLSTNRDTAQEDTAYVAGKDLLRYPSLTMQAMLKFLRLRDGYLASTSEILVTKVLRRLSEWKMSLPEVASEFLEQIITGGTRTILTPQQKAALARALEANLGRIVSVVDLDIDKSDVSGSASNHSSSRGNNSRVALQKRASFKSGTIDIEAWTANAKKQRDVIEVIDDDEFGDSDILDEDILAASSSVERFKLLQQAKQNVEKQVLLKVSRPVAGHKSVQDPKLQIQKQAAQIAFREKRDKENQAKKKRDAEALAKAKKNLQQGLHGQAPGEGSALSKLSIIGKEHAPKGTGMMVSSGSDTESEDELDQELFGASTKAPKASIARQEYNASKAQQARVQVPVKKTRQARTAKDMRARLAPDLSALHKNILSWDFFHNGDFPPNSNRDNYSLVTSSFRNPVEYQNTFEPLLILEAWQAFLKSKEEGYFKNFEIKVANRLTVDSFIEVSTTMDIADGKALGISEADIILLSKANSPTSDPTQPHCLARVWKIKRKQKVMDVLYRVSIGNTLVTSLVPNASIFGVKVASITPLEREYGALQGLKYYDLCDEIVKARASPLLKYTEKQIEPVIAIYKVNAAQAKAVKSAIDNDAFTLIQGPPGSGKTKTIVAIVGALLTSSLRDIGGVKIARPQQTSGVNPIRPSLTPSRKLLVCAPSNAAVDELVMRFKSGVTTLDGEFHKLSIIRLGRSDNINANVLDVTLDELVNARLNIAAGTKTGQIDDVGKLMLDHKSTCEELNALMKVLDESKSKGQGQTPEQSRNFELLKRKKQQISNQIDLLRDNGHTAARDADIRRHKVQQDILDGAHVLCATLSGSGHDMFQNLNIEFETVIIDEAAQSIELSALIPLKYGCAKCIMVGDPKQLPPTVLSREAARFQYEQSLFVRMQSNRPEDVHLLDTQYRMHPEISLFPSQAFYDGRLLDGQGMASLRDQPWHKSKILSPYRFFDVQGAHQSAPKGHSLINVAELEVALQLFDRLTTDCKGYDFTGKVGIITPYKSQLVELRARFASKYGNSIFKMVEFNTTDAFQGRESEIIIFSCVRASGGKGIGFLSDIRRMNVGITRAKSSLWVLGNSQSLMQGEFWAKLIEDARRRDRYTQGDILGMLKTPVMAETEPRRGPAEPLEPRVQDEDVEMIDAPIASGFIAPESQGANLSIGEMTRPEFKSRRLPSNMNHENSDPEHSQAEYRPSGGNGFNEQSMCDWCGSYKHMSFACDNMEATRFKHGCYRCQSKDHGINQCRENRCIECGKFGHLRETCASTKVLSKLEKVSLAKSEMAHKTRLQGQARFQQQRQLGNHDKAVPVVKPTRRTPSPQSQARKGTKNLIGNAQKRKRESSPPSHAPKDSMTTSGSLSHAGVNDPTISVNNRHRNHITPINYTRTNGTGYRASIAQENKGPRSQASNIARNGPARIGPARNGPTPDIRDAGEYRGSSGVTKIPQSQVENARPLDVITATTIQPTDQNTGPPAGSLPRFGPPPQMRRKKPADPFIRPKQRRV